MTTRTPYAGTITAGDDVTATSNNRLPGGWLGHVATTTDQGSITSTEVDLTSLSIAFTAVSTRVYRHTVDLLVANNTINGAVVVKICDASNTELHRGSMHVNLATSTDTLAFTFFEFGISGSVTRKLRCLASGSTQCSIQAATGTAQYMIEDVGSTT